MAKINPNEINKLNVQNRKLENDNVEAQANIKLLEEKIAKRNEKLTKLLEKQKSLEKQK